MAETETVDIIYRVIGVEPVRGAGRLIGLAIVEIEIAGVVIRLQGVQIRRRSYGRVDRQPSMWRNPRTGQWLPAVVLPPELAEALAAEVLSVT
jgi:hypothetical protein